MKYALALFNSVPHNIDQNLMMIERVVSTASKQKIDLVLFGESFLQGDDLLESEALKIDSVGIFKCRMMASNYDINFGVGFYEQHEQGISKSYIIFNKDGTTLIHHRQNQESEVFELMNRRFFILVGDEGFSVTSKLDAIGLWPVYLKVTPKEWFNETMSTYRQQCVNISDEVMLVNTMCESSSYGGGFYLKNQKFVLNQPMEQEGLSIFED